jgi:hypothetical protein
VGSLPTYRRERRHLGSQTPQRSSPRSELHRVLLITKQVRYSLRFEGRVDGDRVDGDRGTRTPCLVLGLAPHAFHAWPARLTGSTSKSGRQELHLRPLRPKRSALLIELRPAKVHQGVAPCSSGLQSDVSLSDSWTEYGQQRTCTPPLRRRSVRFSKAARALARITARVSSRAARLDSPPGTCTQNPPVNNRTL